MRVRVQAMQTCCSTFSSVNCDPGPASTLSLGTSLTWWLGISLELRLRCGAGPGLGHYSFGFGYSYSCRYVHCYCHYKATTPTSLEDIHLHRHLNFFEEHSTMNDKVTLMSTRIAGLAESCRGMASSTSLSSTSQGCHTWSPEGPSRIT